jgi:membrane peptidoglycan carboxypeptidase
VAAEGMYCAPLPVNSITDAAGRAVSVGNPSCKRVIGADVARAATDAARCPVGDQSAYGRCDDGTATQVRTIMGGRPIAGKTGSSEENATETVALFTPELAAAAIAANPDDPSDHVGSPVQVKVVNAVANTLAAALNGRPRSNFTAPSTAAAYGFG